MLLLEQLSTFELEHLIRLPESASACDALLDQRDQDPKFEAEWTKVHRELSARRSDLTQAQLGAVEFIRREAFFLASRMTHQHEIASYISDDFELFALASGLAQDNAFLENLFGSYLHSGFGVPQSTV